MRSASRGSIGDYDDLDGDARPPNTRSFLWALSHALHNSFGAGDTDGYEMADSSQSALLWLFYVANVIIMLVVLINMLIALMVDIMTRMSQDSDTIILRSKLLFVSAHWSQLSPDLRTRNFLITAKFSDESDV